MKIYEGSSGYTVENVIPYFQSITDIKQNVVWGYECLARLVDHGQKVRLPAEFFHLLQEDTALERLTRKIFHSSARCFRNTQEKWSINITEKDVSNPQTIGFLEHYLAEYPNAHRVMLEIGADTVFNYSKQFKAFLLLGKTLDIQILIDGFNDPFRQLPQTLNYPIDGVKLHSKYFVAENSEEKLNPIREKAEKNHIAIIAEQIENVETYEKVSALGIQYGQGFFISYPQSKVA